MRTAGFILGVVLIASGCAQPMRLEATARNVPRPDGTAIRTYIVTDKSLPADSYDAIALCVVPADRAPTDALEDLAGACAAGCRILLIESSNPAANRIADHLLALRAYVESIGARPRSVLVIGIGAGGEVAAAVAGEEPGVSHLVLLDPTTVHDAALNFRGPVFVALIGAAPATDALATDHPPSNITVRRYPAVDQDWRERATGRTIRPLVEMDLLTWLVETRALTSDRAQRLAARVRANHREWYGR